MSSVLTVLICSWARAAVRLISALAGLAGPAARAALTMTYSGAKFPPKDCAVADRGVRTASEAPPQRRARLDMENSRKRMERGARGQCRTRCDAIFRRRAA